MQTTIRELAGAAVLVGSCLAIGRLVGFELTLVCAVVVIIIAIVLAALSIKVWFAQAICVGAALCVFIVFRSVAFGDLSQALGAIGICTLIWLLVYRKAYAIRRYGLSADALDLSRKEFVEDVRHSALILTVGAICTLALSSFAICISLCVNLISTEIAGRLHFLLALVIAAVLTPCYSAIAAEFISRRARHIVPQIDRARNDTGEVEE